MRTRTLLADARGASAFEYVVAVALVALVSVGAWASLGGVLDEDVRCVASAIADATGECARAEAAGGGAPTVRAGPPSPAGADLAALLPALPQSVVEALRAQGTEIVLSPEGLAAVRPDLADLRPRGWPEGTTFGHDGRGLYDPRRNQIVVARGGGGDGMFSPAYVAAHEIGHALDLPRGLSARADFIRAYDASGFDVRSRAAMEETFADSFASFVTDRARFAERYPALAAYWTEHVSSFGAASPSLLSSAGDVIRPFGWGDLNPINHAAKLGHAGARAVEGGAHAVRDMATGMTQLAGYTLLVGADSLRSTYELLSGNRTGSTAARESDPYAKALAASFEQTAGEARRRLRDTPRGIVDGAVQTGADIVSGDPYRMGYGLTTLGLTIGPPGAGAGRVAAAGMRRALVRARRIPAREAVPRAQPVERPVVNANARIPAESYTRPHYRDLDGYRRSLGDDFAAAVERLEEGDVWIDAGGGFGIAALQASTSKGVVSYVINAQDFWRAPMKREVVESLTRDLNVDVSDVPVEVRVGRTVGREFHYNHYGELSTQDYAKLRRRIRAVKSSAERRGRFHYLVGFAEHRLPDIPPARARILPDVYGAYFYSADRARLLDAYYRALRPGGQAFIRVRTPATRHGDGVGPGSIVETGAGRESFEAYLVRRYPSIFRFSGRDADVLIMTRRSGTEALDLGRSLVLTSTQIVETGRMELPHVVFRER